MKKPRLSRGFRKWLRREKAGIRHQEPDPEKRKERIAELLASLSKQ